MMMISNLVKLEQNDIHKLAMNAIANMACLNKGYKLDHYKETNCLNKK